MRIFVSESGNLILKSEDAGEDFIFKQWIKEYKRDELGFTFRDSGGYNIDYISVMNKLVTDELETE